MGADLSVRNDRYKHIWKFLSFEEMNEILKDLPKGYVIDVDVDLSDIGLTQLSDFSKIKVGGDFDCYSNQLISLEGAPSEVGRDFDCSFIRLIDLKGAPSEVGGDFYCLVNNLISLEGKPLKIGGKFYIEKEKLVMIEMADKIKKLGALGKKMFLGNKEM